MVKNEGNVEVGGSLPYPISYRSLTPRRSECTNLLVPVCLSASHIAYGSIRMEPVFMVLGQVAALSCAQALGADCCDVQDVDSRTVNVAIDENPYMDGSQPDILIDDADSGVTATSGWKRCEKAGDMACPIMKLHPEAAPRVCDTPQSSLPMGNMQSMPTSLCAGISPRLWRLTLNTTALYAP